MINDMRYIGFVDTCVQYGIEKSAAERIYKEGQVLKLLPSAIGAAWNAAKSFFPAGIQGARAAWSAARPGATAAAKAVAPAAGAARGAVKTTAGNTGKAVAPAVNATKNTVVNARKAVGKATTRARALKGVADGTAKSVASPSAVAPGVSPATPVTAPAPGATARKTIKKLVRRRRRLASKGTQSAQNAPTGTTPPLSPQTPPGSTPTGPEPTASSFIGNALEKAKHSFSGKYLSGPFWNFMSKHPKLGTLGTSVGTAYLVNKLNGNFRNSQNDVLDVMTPQEQMQWQRMNQGNYLPGLGLDPYYFNGIL